MKTIRHLITLVTVVVIGSSGFAQERNIPRIASVGSFANDTFWDREDRWRTGSYQRSLLVGYGEYEARLRLEFISPDSFKGLKRRIDRPYAGIFQLGLHHNAYDGPNVYSYGFYVEGINELKAWNEFHRWSHRTFEFRQPIYRNYIVEPATFFGFQSAWRGEYQLSNGYLIPFIEAELGTRNRMTIGLDAVLSDNSYTFYTRDQTTGILLNRPEYVTKPEKPDIDIFYGLDASYVGFDYTLQNPISKITNEEFRYRIRGGVRFSYKNVSIAIGPTFLSKEFVEQKEHQVLQTFSLRLLF